MQNFLRYSNGFGILIMSVVIFAGGLVLALWPTTDGAMKATGLGFMISVVGYWTATSAANNAARAIASAAPAVTMPHELGGQDPATPATPAEPPATPAA